MGKWSLKDTFRDRHCGVAWQASTLDASIPYGHWYQVPDATLSIHFPAANMPGKVVEEGPSAWVPAPIQETQKKFLAPDFGFVQLCLLYPFGE